MAGQQFKAGDVVRLKSGGPGRIPNLPLVARAQAPLAQMFRVAFVSNEPHAPNCRLIGHVFLSDLLNRHV